MDQELTIPILESFPSGVTVVTAVSADGTPCGVTCTAMCSVSINPPRLLVCVGRSSHVSAAIQRSGRFVVNIMAAHAEDVTRLFSAEETGSFSALEWGPARTTDDAPILVRHIVAYAECHVVQSIEVSDCCVFVADIVEGDADHTARPLLHYRQAYSSWPPSVSPLDPVEEMAKTVPHRIDG